MQPFVAWQLAARPLLPLSASDPYSRGRARARDLPPMIGGKPRALLVLAGQPTVVASCSWLEHS